MSTSNIKTFSVSDLKPVTKLDHEDLLLVSDYDDKGKCRSRKLQIGDLMNQIVKDSVISKGINDPQSNIGKAVRNAIDIDVDKITQ